LIWALLGSGRISKWRIIESTGLPAREFDAGWKLGFLVENPLHFPAALLASLHVTVGTLWRQLIGVHGWLDTTMQDWVYPVLTLLLLVTVFERLSVDRAYACASAGSASR